MAKRLVDKHYLHTIADMPCCCCQIEDGTIVPHHLMRGVFRGMGRKADDCWVIPLCYKCHEGVTRNETEFLAKFNIDGKTLAETLWKNRYPI